jgi:hypothetical protein
MLIQGLRNLPQSDAIMLLRLYNPSAIRRRCLAGSLTSQQLGIGRRRYASTEIVDAVDIGEKNEIQRRQGVFFISNVLPIRIGRFE